MEDNIPKEQTDWLPPLIHTDHTALSTDQVLQNPPLFHELHQYHSNQALLLLPLKNQPAYSKNPSKSPSSAEKQS